MSFGTAYATMKRGKKCMAKGGEVNEMGEYDPMQHPMPEMNEAAEHEDMDMIDRIMKKRFSRGGRVANDVGVAEADKLPAEYDDLVLRDDLEGHYNDEDLGDPAQEERNADVIARVLASRRKKDRMPRPA